MSTTLAADNFWLEKSNCHNAEYQYQEFLGKQAKENKLNLIIADNSQLNGLHHEQEEEIAPPASATKLKKSKKLKNKKNESLTKKLTTGSATNAENLTEHTEQPVKMGTINKTSAALAGGEKHKKRNKTIKKNNSDTLSGNATNSQCTLVSEIAKAREHIKNSLEKMDGITTLSTTPASGEVLDRVAAIEKDNAELRKLIESLKSVCLETQSRVSALEQHVNAQLGGGKSGATPAIAPVTKAAAAADDDDDDVDLFGSDDEEADAEAARVREERLAAYATKKSKKPQIIAKSSLILDVKPWDDETDLKDMETEIRKIATDGLLWGASKFVPVAFGIQKLSISCVVEDDKVSIDWLTEEIEKLEDYVQSVDVAAFNKI